MAVSKCDKCGANIPEGAGFCPACGAPKAAAQPAPAPVKSGGTDLQSLMDTIFSSKLMMIGFFIGVLVAWISRLIMQFLDYGTLPYDALSIIRFTFMVGVGGLLLCGGFLNTKLNIYVRAASIAAGAILIAVFI